jgi:hypothetical protein
MRAAQTLSRRYRSSGEISVLLATLIGACTLAPVQSLAQTLASTQLLPASREEVADQEYLSWSLAKFPPQPYMREVYWAHPSDTPPSSAIH